VEQAKLLCRMAQVKMSAESAILSFKVLQWSIKNVAHSAKLNTLPAITGWKLNVTRYLEMT
jgi:hypothetical protein